MHLPDPNDTVLLLLRNGFSFRPSVELKWSRDGNVYTEQQALDVLRADNKPREMTSDDPDNEWRMLQ